MATKTLHMMSVLNNGQTASMNIFLDTTAVVGSALGIEMLNVPTTNSSKFVLLDVPYNVYDVVFNAATCTGGVLQLFVDSVPTRIFISLGACLSNNPGRIKFNIPLSVGNKLEWRVAEAIAFT